MDIALLYRFRFAAEGGAADRAVRIEALRQSGATREEAQGISGFLLDVNGQFYHVLEGEFAAVSAVFAEALADPSLSGIEMISLSPITARAFSGWSMASVAAETPSATRLKTGLLDDYAARFGQPKPVLRDILSHIAGEMTRMPLWQVGNTAYSAALPA